jgi:group I intron endonuclease
MQIEYPRVAAIYKLTCLKNGKVYIGKTIDLKRRINNHKNSRIIPNKKYMIASAIVKHGWDTFDVEILETFEYFNKMDKSHNDEILLKESVYIDTYQSTDNEKGYNICKHSTDRTGQICSEESKEKMSIAQKNVKRIMTDELREKYRINRLGKKMSEEAKEKISKASLGRRHTEESKKKMSIAKKGVKMTHVVSEETREKRRRALIGRSRPPEVIEKIRKGNTGKKLSEEHIKNMREAAKNRVYFFSEETRKKISVANTGRKCSEETKEKIRKANTGRKCSKETKEKIRKSKKESDNKRKNNE